MWFFNRKKMAKQQEQEEKEKYLAHAAELKRYIGTKMLVSTVDMDDLFSAALTVSNDGQAKLKQLTNTSFLGLIDLRDEKVRMRGFFKPESITLQINGSIDKDIGDLWLLKQFEYATKGSERRFERYEISVPGKFSGSRCNLVNISQGGACMRCRVFYPKNSQGLFSSSVLPRTMEHPASATVVNVRELQNGKYEYGLQFMDSDKSVMKDLSMLIVGLKAEKHAAQRGEKTTEQ